MSILDSDSLHKAATHAGSQYHQLVLLVGESGSGKSERLRQFASALKTDVVNVNRALSKLLLDLTARQRCMHLAKVLTDVLSTDQVIVVVDNLEVLFDVGLKQDPLRLLQGVSRNTTIVASWNGTVTGETLTYAQPGHPEYRAYKTTDLTIVRC